MGRGPQPGPKPQGYMVVGVRHGPIGVNGTRPSAAVTAAVTVDARPLLALMRG